MTRTYVRRGCTGALVTLITALSSQGAQAQDTSFTLGFEPGTTCAAVHEKAQREGGGDVDMPPPPVPRGSVQAPTPPAAKPPGPWDSFATKRSFQTGSPNVRYSCDGDARVRSQIVDIWFETREAAVATYASYAKQLRARLGAPCWDTEALSQEQRKSLQSSDDFTLQKYQQRVEWHGPVNTQLFMTSRNPTSWTVYVNAVDARVRNDDIGEVERKIRAMGKCDPVVQLPTVSDSDDAPTILTKWFAHVSERGYTATVDFLSSQEKQRFHATVIELTRRVHGTASESLLRGLAGDGVSAEETLAALEKSTPDSWLRDVLNSKFRTAEGLFRYSKMDILGTIPEGDITHVIARMQFDSSSGPIAAVQSFDFKRSGQRLEMQLTPELQALELGFRVMTHTLASAP